MGWRESLVRLADYEVEQLQMRLAEVVERRTQLQMKLAFLHAEAESECARAAADAESGWYRVGYLQTWRLRRDALKADIAVVEAEEAGARDGLGQAFEELKKYEQLMENAAAAERRRVAAVESAVLDELGARRASGR